MVTTFGTNIKHACGFLLISYLASFPKYRGLLVKMFSVDRRVLLFNALFRGLDS